MVPGQIRAGTVTGTGTGAGTKTRTENDAGTWTVLSGTAVSHQGIQKQKKRIASYLMGAKQDFNDSGSRRIKDWTTVFRIEKVAILKSWRKESDHGTNENRTISRQVIDMQYEFFKILVQKKIISKYQVY